MKDIVRIGMIGAGHIAHAHAEAWQKEATLTAVCQPPYRKRSIPGGTA